MADPAGERARARGPDRGSVLLLMPAAVLVVLVLGAIAVDAAVAFLAERELAGAAAAAANDAATAGLDEVALRQGAAYRLDPSLVEAAVAASLDAQGLPPGTSVSIAVEGDEVRVTLAAEADLVFSPSIPGAPDTVAVSATASAAAVSR